MSSKNSDSYKSQTLLANDHNSWNSGYSCSSADFQSLDTTHILDARQASGDLPEDVFMRLKEGCDLIDAGVDVNLGYNGSAPDLGCFEYPGEHHDPIPDDTIPDVQPGGTHAVAFVSLPKAPADTAILNYLRKNDVLWVKVTDATDAKEDYSPFELIVLGSTPNSSAAGFTALKGYDKPMLMLKPFLLKNTVWNWGTPVNSKNLSITVTAPEHPLFQGLTLTEGNQLQVFSQCSTNAVTGMSTWTNTTGFNVLATTSSDTTVVADFPAGTNCNGTILPQRLVMIGVSEYSTAYLTEQGKRLIENAILYLLGVERPEGIETIEKNTPNRKYIHNGKLFIQVDETTYDAFGQRVY